MEVTPIIEGAHLVRLASGRALMIGAPPEAVKVLLLWEWPTPAAVVLAPDPLYAHGVNQASFEFLLYSYLFREQGLASRQPFCVVCDESQQPRVERLVREMLRGPSDEHMEAWGTPETHRRQLLREMRAVSGVVAHMEIEELVRIIPFRGGRATLPDGTELEDLAPDDCRVTAEGRSVHVPRRPRGRGTLPFFFAEPERPLEGPRFGLQVIGSGSGFSGADWSSCFVVWINGLPLIVDGTPYLDEHLERLGIEEDLVTGYLITHNHEDHANAIGQLVNRRRVTVLTAPPVMAGLVTRLAAILDRPHHEVRAMLDWVPLRPGLQRLGPPVGWYGATIRTWYSVHTIPTVGVEVAVDDRRIRLPGDTLWGKQLLPLVQSGTISRARERFVQGTYWGADIVVADAGGGPIHPDPGEVHELQLHSTHRLLLTHAPAGTGDLQNVRSGAVVTLIEGEPPDASDLIALTRSSALHALPERWLIALARGGSVVTPEKGSQISALGSLAVLRGSLDLQAGDGPRLQLQRGDLYHPDLLPEPLSGQALTLQCRAEWTRLLVVPEAIYQDMMRSTGLRRRLRRLYETRGLWYQVAQSELPLETLVALSQAGQSRHYPQGTAILNEGDHADGFHVLVEGHVEVVRHGTNGGERVGLFGPGYSFGETGIMNGAPRNATVRALDNVTTFEIPAGAFRQHLLGTPRAHLELARNRDRRLVGRRD